ncbi:MAG: alpha/beta hydrolase [Marinilabiliales bacterium]
MFIQIDDKKIFYKWINEELLSEKDTVIILLHQGLGCVEMWKDYPDKLSKATNLPVLVYDRYGHGKSSIRNEFEGLDFMVTEAERLQLLINTLQLKKKVILYGHSDGGTIALIYAAKYPENAKAVFTEAAHVINEKETVNGIKDLVIQYDTQGLKNKLEKYHNNNTENLFNFWSKAWLRENSKTWNIKDYLKRINTVVYSIQGENDAFGTEKQLYIIKDYTNAVIKIIKDCGHQPHKEKPEETLQLFIDFYNNH